MNRQLLLLHGRSQEHKDSVALKAEWLDSLGEGLAKINVKLPIAEKDVRFPFYGDTLSDLVDGARPIPRPRLSFAEMPSPMTRSVSPGQS